MLKFLADENLRKEVVEFLMSRGHDIARPLAGTSDIDVAAMAKKEERILVTHDLGFSNIFWFPPHEYAGIIVLRILPPNVNTIINAVKNLLATLNKNEFNGKLIILEPARFRVYKEGISKW